MQENLLVRFQRFLWDNKPELFNNFDQRITLKKAENGNYQLGFIPLENQENDERLNNEMAQAMNEFIMQDHGI